MRAERQKINLLTQGGADEDDILSAKVRYNGTSDEYVKFSRAMGLPQQRQRVTVDGLGNIGNIKKRIIVDISSAKTFEKSAESGIMKVEETLEDKKKKFTQLTMSNEDEYYNWQEEYYNKNEPLINEVDITAIEEYSDGSYEAINGVERFEKGSVEYNKICKKYRVSNLDEYKESSDKLSSAISKFKLEDNLIVHRYVTNIDYITGLSSAEDIIKSIGKNYHEKGYVSTCVFEGQTKHFGGQNLIHLQILVPKNSNCAYINKFSEKKDLEFELLLNRGTDFKILDGGERPVKVMRWDSNLHKMVEKEEKEKYITLEVII
ncbi:MAG: ADP-ribosyltransferase [Ruminococcus sp.]